MMTGVGKCVVAKTPCMLNASVHTASTAAKAGPARLRSTARTRFGVAGPVAYRRRRAGGGVHLGEHLLPAQSAEADEALRLLTRPIREDHRGNDVQVVGVRHAQGGIIQ